MILNDVMPCIHEVVCLTHATDTLQRKATLLQEYQQRGRAGLFIDRRFGANDEDTPEGEKAIVRFQKERMVRT